MSRPSAKLDDGVLADAASTQGHREHITHGADALPSNGFSEVVVPVPARLLRRVSDSLEDRLGAGRDLPAGAHHVRRRLNVRHARIEPLRD
jgi:hypothetical protein